ncbi:MAG: SixA phosphatase family protein [Burkholderiales bacterium]
MTNKQRKAQLILWRHAHAEEGDIDEQRALTSRGRKQAVRISKWLQERLPDRYHLIASPLVRAQQTAQALERKFRTIPELSVEGKPRKILQAISWPECGGTTVLVGHQPSLGCLAAFLLVGRELPWEIRKGAAWWLQREDNIVTLKAVIDPALV